MWDQRHWSMLTKSPSTDQVFFWWKDVVVASRFLNQTAAFTVYSKADLLQQFYMMQHRDRNCKSNLLSRLISIGGRNSLLVVFGLAVHSVAGSILLWRNFPVEWIFPLELTWAQTPFPQTLSDESINRGLVCAHMHFIAQTQKILTFMS